MPRPSARDERRQQIVDAMAAVLAREGYARATTQAVAREAGLSPGLVHYHFASKQDVLLALVATLGQRARQRYERRIADGGGGAGALGRLHAWLDAQVSRGEGVEAEAACSLAIAAEAVHEPEVRAAWGTVVEERLATARALVEAAVAERGGSGDARSVAAVLVAAVDGALLMGVTGGDRAPAGLAGSSIRALADALVGAKAAPAELNPPPVEPPVEPRPGWAVWDAR